MSDLLYVLIGFVLGGLATAWVLSLAVVLRSTGKAER